MTAADHIKGLEKRVAVLTNEVRKKDAACQEKSRQLDAMGWVWCSAGCVGGVFKEDLSRDLTEEMVLMAESNTRRMRSAFEARQHRKARLQT